MARKNLLNVSSDENLEQERGTKSSDNRPLAGLKPKKSKSTPVGGITKTLGNITEKMERADDLERKLTEGFSIVQIDPSQIVGSFVQDRLASSAKDDDDFYRQIETHGQQSPILVRPYPDDNTRYQIAFGHRRCAAALKLNRKVNAVVKNLTDKELVVIQGQENSARTNLSYVERALFAATLEDRGFERNVIQSALKVDRAAISKMIKLIRNIPRELIVAIGAAPKTGRRKWEGLSALLGTADLPALVSQLSMDKANELSSDERFELAYSEIKRPSRRADKNSGAQVDDLPVSFKITKSAAEFIIDAKKAPGFDEFIKLRLSALYADYIRERNDK